MIRIPTIVLALAAGAWAAPIKGEVQAQLPSQKFEFMGADAGGELWLTFKLRYSLGSFFGEPVLRFSPHYSFGSFLTLTGRDGTKVKFMRDTGSAKVTLVARPDPHSVIHETGGVIAVPAKVFDKIEIVRYEALLNLGWAAWKGGRTEAKIVVNNEGLLGRCGEWGWDIGGSPNWDQLFLRTGADTAKELYRKFMDEAAKGDPPRASMELTSIDVDLSSFRHEIIKQLPGAFDPLYRGGLDRQARALIDAAVEKLRANPGGSIAADLNRRRDITDRFFQQFGGRLDASLRQEWEQLKKAIEYAPQIDKRIQDLKRAADSGGLTDENRAVARQLVATGAIRSGLVPRSSSQALAAVVRQLASTPVGSRAADPEATQNPSFFVWVARYSKGRTGKCEGVSKLFRVTYRIDPSRDRGRPSMKSLALHDWTNHSKIRGFLDDGQWRRFEAWLNRFRETGSSIYSVWAYGDEKDAQLVHQGIRSPIIPIDDPPDLTR